MKHIDQHSVAQFLIENQYELKIEVVHAFKWFFDQFPPNFKDVAQVNFEDILVDYIKGKVIDSFNLNYGESLFLDKEYIILILGKEFLKN